jgi:hypothetical protein
LANSPREQPNHNITAFVGDRKEDAQKANKRKGPDVSGPLNDYENFM